jgi:hypothetical protein
LLFGAQIQGKYQIIVDDAEAVGTALSKAIGDVRRDRSRTGDAYYFNWLLNITEAQQKPFLASHEQVAALKLGLDAQPEELAVQVRQALSAIVSGNVKEMGIRAIRKHGPFKLRADRKLVDALDHLLTQFAVQGRMKLSGQYEPCYEVIPF